MRWLSLITSAVALLIAAALLLPDYASAQKEPKPRPGVPVATWQVYQDSRVRPPGVDASGAAQFGEVRLVYGRNDDTLPRVVTGLRFSRCVNLRIACGRFPLDVILAPGERLMLLAVYPAAMGSRFSATIEIESSVATRCVGVADSVSNAKEVSNPEPAQLVIPPMPSPASLRERTLTVQFFVNASGHVDSIAADSIDDRRYRDRFRDAMLNYRFRPATWRKCPVAGTTSIRVSFSP